MKKIASMNGLVKEIFKSPKNFIVFPFSIVGIVFVGYFYLLTPFYMLSELFLSELRSIIVLDNDKDSNGAQIVKNLLGFGIVVVFNFLRAIMTIPLAICYFMTSIMFLLSSLGSVKYNPFEYSTQK